MERSWIETNAPLVEAAFASFTDHDQGPAVERVQRQLDRPTIGPDVRDALARLPRIDGESRSVAASHVVLPMRVLHHLPAAADTLHACLAILQYAQDLYVKSDVDADLTFTNKAESLR